MFKRIPSVLVEREIDCDLGVVLALDSPVDISHSSVKIGLINERSTFLAPTDEYRVNNGNSTRQFPPISVAARGRTSRNNEGPGMRERTREIYLKIENKPIFKTAAEKLSESMLRIF